MSYLTAVNFYTEDGEWAGKEFFTFGFTTNEVVISCMTRAKVWGKYITAVRPDGFSCGFWGPED